MANSEHNPEQFSEQKPKEVRKLSYNNLQINQKIRFILIVISLISIVVIGILSFINSRNSLQRVSFDQLKSITEIKRRAIEDYFRQTRNQVRTFASDRMVIDALEEFNDAFKMVDIDTNTVYSEDDLLNMEANLENFYSTSFVTPLNTNLNKNTTVESFWPENKKSKILQYHYISNNPNPEESKDVLNKATDGSKYSEVHSKYHPIFKDYLEKFGYNDIYLVDGETGNIVYSVSKRTEFATSLLTGPYRNTNVSFAYEMAKNSTIRDYSILVDLDFYSPLLGSPCAFIASPVYNDVIKSGVLIFQISIDKINEIMTGNMNWKKEGYGESGESYLVGDDLKLRSESRRLIQNKNEYLETLHEMGTEDNIIEKINNLNTGILLQDVDTKSAQDALAGRSGEKITRDYLDEKVLSSYSRVNIDNVNWGIISDINVRETFQPIRRLGWNIIFFMILLLIIVNFIGNYFSKAIAKRIISIKDAISYLVRGESFDKLEDTSEDEIGQTAVALNKLADRLDSASEFAVAIGKGDFSYDYEISGENDRLGNSLLQMKKSLQDAKEEEQKRMVEDEKRNWSTQGIAKFGEILRSDNDNLNRLSYNIISNLVDYMKANQGGIFLMNKEDRDDIHLELLAAYAYNRQKHLSKRIEPGEGLVGTCAIEKKTIYLTEIPDDYINITSGLGDANPSSLLIVPLKVEEDVLGIIEIASFNELQPHEIEFVERLAESIATTLTTVQINARTAKLLEESKDKANALAQQEEEMRQNMEEMQATQEELARIKAQEKNKEEKVRSEESKLYEEIKKQNEELKRNEDELRKQKEETEATHRMMFDILENIPGKVFVKDNEGKIIIANTATARLYDKTIDELIGSSDFDHYPKKEAEEFFEEEKQVMRQGQKTWYQEEMNQGRMTYLMTTKMPFYIETLKKQGLLGIQIDITEMRKMGEEEYKQKLNEKMKEAEKYLNELNKVKEKINKLKGPIE